MFARVFVLTFFLALAIHTANELGGEGTDSPGQVDSIRINSMSAPNLPNSCEILAVEKELALRAKDRLDRASSSVRHSKFVIRHSPPPLWTRILIVSYPGGKTRHALCVFQPHRKICAYDDTCTMELETSSHDAQVIARALAAFQNRRITDGVFLK